MRTYLAVATAVIAILATWAISSRLHDPSGETFRIGFEESPPEQIITPEGRATGPAIELVREAARRRRIRLQWIHMLHGPEEAMARGTVDLWPLFGDIRDRKNRFFISKPWASRHFWFMVDAKSAIREIRQLAGKSIAVRHLTLDEPIARRQLPDSRLLPRSSAQEVLVALCSGEADASFLWERSGGSAALEQTSECGGKTFRYIGPPSLEIYSGVAASLVSPRAKWAAMAIRDEISQMAREGLESSIYFNWSKQSISDTQIIDLVADAGRRNEQLTAAFGMVLLIAAVVAWQNQRLKMLRRTADEAARRSDRATAVKSEFLANMSHEIRTPMNGIMGTCELLLETPPGPQQIEYGRTILNCTRALLDILNGILDFSKIEAGRMEIHAEPFDLAGLVNGVVNLLAARASEKGIGFDMRIDQCLSAWYMGDSVRIRQVLLNLAANAVKFTVQGAVTIYVEPVVSPGSGTAPRVLFAIQDTGIGIPAGTQAKLFEKFTQADASTTRRFGGTGLGLAICKQLVELMGGRISLESEEGRGSRFSFDLMLAPTAPAVESPIAAPSTRMFDGARILIAEDNAVNQQILRRMLERRGCVADVAANGIEAAALAARNEYSLILMDCQMPEMDGFEATRRIHAQRQGPPPPIIAVTAHAMEQDRQACIAAGMADHLVKPISAASVDAILGKWLVAAPVPVEA